MVPDQIFKSISYEGVPDIRIIVLMGYPVMAMLRLPTRQSGGKANLHQGAIGVGVDLATGVTLRGTWLNNKISKHPDTTNAVDGVQLPNWDGFMKLAAGCYELCGLGYIGVDMVLDQDKGPLILELNARPGLNIQIANDCGLTHRAHAVEARIAELEGLLAKYKAVPPVRNTQNAPRIGEDYRKGADVTPEQFQEAFGFRGVQFGNYVEGGRRQQDLNRAYDALMDLAGVLALPPRALSLGGRLGLAVTQ